MQRQSPWCYPLGEPSVLSEGARRRGIPGGIAVELHRESHQSCPKERAAVSSREKSPQNYPQKESSVLFEGRCGSPEKSTLLYKLGSHPRKLKYNSMSEAIRCTEWIIFADSAPQGRKKRDLRTQKHIFHWKICENQLKIPEKLPLRGSNNTSTSPSGSYGGPPGPSLPGVC